MEVRRRTTLSEQLASLPPSNLRDLLSVRQDEEAEEHGGGGRRVVTLGAVLASEKRGGGGRTLFEIIRDEEDEANAASPAAGGRVLGDILGLDGGSSGPAVDSGGSSAAGGGGGEGVGEAAAEEQPVRASLMALLEESDRLGGVSGAALLGASAMEENEGACVWCCVVCMVRHKGAAFIPCGHAFCRPCAREVCSGRAACPLCNAPIIEILDIF